MQNEALLSDIVTFCDPNTNENIEITVYRDDKTGRYFGVDTSYLIDEDVSIVSTPFGHDVELVDEVD